MRAPDEKRAVVCGLPFRRLRDYDERGRAVLETFDGPLGPRPGDARLFATLRDAGAAGWVADAALRRIGEPDATIFHAYFHGACGHAAAAVCFDGMVRGFVYNWRRKRGGRAGA